MPHSRSERAHLATFTTPKQTGLHHYHHAHELDERLLASPVRVRARVLAGGHDGARLGGRSRLLLPSGFLPERRAG